MEELYSAYKDREDVRFLIVYTREPHARQVFPGWNFLGIGQSKDYDQRKDYARACRKDHGMDMPILIDTMDGKVQKTYGGLPNNVIVIDKDGNIAAKKRWNDPLFVELALHDLVEDPPRVDHVDTLGNCAECHEKEVRTLTQVHPITECGACHSYFYNRLPTRNNIKAKRHSDNPKRKFNDKMVCSVLCHNTDFMPKEREVAGLKFAHTRHINRGATCINCHGTAEAHDFGSITEQVCTNCHVEVGSTELKKGVKMGDD